MNSRQYILLLILSLISCFNVGAQDKVYIIPDRTSCVSGDTIWFNTVVFNNLENNTGKIVHVQLDNLENKHITKVSVVSDRISGDGYLHIPDSLSSGIYVLTAFTNTQKYDAATTFNQRLISVYNRFDTEVAQLNFPAYTLQNLGNINGVEVLLKKSPDYKKRLAIDINVPEKLLENTDEMIVTARLVDPISESFATGWITQNNLKTEIASIPVDEKNGVLVTGKVFSNNDSSPVEGAKVLLSISDKFPYLDYCVTDEDGLFYFYIRNAYGIGNLVIQELTNTPEANSVILFENYIETRTLTQKEKVLKSNERYFAEDIIKAAYFDRFFKKNNSLLTDSFSITHEFKYPFYGEPTKQFDPDLFIDLPDFKEISREILNGVQYRDRKGEISIRMLDYGSHSVFNDQPFMLLDGVPVFDPEIFSDMGTSQIESVDAVFYRRFFGDLSFSGVLAVYTKTLSLSWLEKYEAVHLISYPCIQPKKKWNYTNTTKTTSRIPNFKKVFFRKKWDKPDGSKSLSFDVSDIQGDVVLEITLVNRDKKILHHTELLKTD